MAKDDVIIRLNDELYNPEKRSGQPRWTGGKAGKGERLLTTWYTCGIFRSYADEKLLDRLKGDRVIAKNRKYVLVERARNVYYGGGRFYRSASRRNTERRGEYARFEPITGSVWTCRPKYQQKWGLPDAEILVSEGYPHTVRVGEDAF